MDAYDATELAYKRGYEQGKKDAVVHGRWNRVRFFANATLYHCSICDHAEIKTYNYCPNCGAKMDGDE